MEMNRRTFLKAAGATALVTMVPRGLRAATTTTRCRPIDAAWPSQTAWKQLNETVGGNLIPVDFPLSILESDPDSDAAKLLLKDLKNPYYIREQPGLTETLGWVDAWETRPSVYAVAARNAQDIAAAVNFARQNNLRLAVKGGGHSYQGTSNAPDSLLIWTRNMHDIEIHDAFVPQGCAHALEPQAAVTVGAGTIDMQAYQTVTTKGGRYVQAGGCTTVCLGGLVQSGGFGSHSRRYGTAASNLLEAEVVTADGRIRIANSRTNPDLFWALKGGGGGTFGVVSKMTLRLHDLPELFGAAIFKIKATSDDAYRRLIHEFVSFYRKNLFNQYWGEQVSLGFDNTLAVSMLSNGLDTNRVKLVWQPFLNGVERSAGYSFKSPALVTSFPAQRYWDVKWNPSLKLDGRPGAPSDNAWWEGDALQVGWFIWGFQSLWMPASLLADDQQSHLADALFSASRSFPFQLQFSKGLAGGAPDAIARTRDTATNPAVLDAFGLVVAADAQGPAFPDVPGHPPGIAYPGIPGHEPATKQASRDVSRMDHCMNQLRALVPNGGAYVSESDYFQKNWQQAYWGSNYGRLAEIKKKYDPEGLFIVHNGVGSEGWSRDGFTKL
jgi:FAD/FMN-containing dehydrogenase